MKRIEVLDVWRSFCVLIMVVYHALYDAALFGKFSMAFFDRPAMLVLRYVTAGCFIFISGLVSARSNRGIRRGFTIFCLGFAVTVVTTLAGMQVAFGILQFMGIAMMLCGLVKKYCGIPKKPWFALACAALFILCACTLPGFTVNSRWLYPLGVKYAGFASADYFPIFPWIFLTLLGAWCGAYVFESEAKILKRQFPKVLTFPGKHSLLIYLLHQPILYGICLLLWG